MTNDNDTADQADEATEAEWVEHPVLDRAFVCADMFERFVLTHQATQSDPELREVAQKLSAQLYDFYQLCGSK